jgi:phage shock protein PspC (stress-responsive transcriptional regulator)
MQMNRRLYRCRENRMLAGVASGVAEFFDLDPTLVRVLWFLSVFVGGLGILLYIGLAIIVPLEPASDAAAHAADNHGAGLPDGHRHRSRGSGRLTMFIGIGLILFGALALIDIALPGWASWRQLWPLLVISLGGLLIVGALRRERESAE